MECRNWNNEYQQYQKEFQKVNNQIKAMEKAGLYSASGSGYCSKKIKRNLIKNEMGLIERIQQTQRPGGYKQYIIDQHEIGDWIQIHDHGKNQTFGRITRFNKKTITVGRQRYQYAHVYPLANDGTIKSKQMWWQDFKDWQNNTFI